MIFFELYAYGFLNNSDPTDMVMTSSCRSALGEGTNWREAPAAHTGSKYIDVRNTQTKITDTDASNPHLPKYKFLLHQSKVKCSKSYHPFYNHIKYNGVQSTQKTTLPIQSQTHPSTRQFNIDLGQYTDGSLKRSRVPHIYTTQTNIPSKWTDLIINTLAPTPIFI